MVVVVKEALSPTGPARAAARTRTRIIILKVVYVVVLVVTALPNVFWVFVSANHLFPRQRLR